jgi:hypothetical protein
MENAGHGSVGGGTTISHDRDHRRRYAAPQADFSKRLTLRRPAL